MFKKKPQSPENIRKASESSESNGSSAVPSDDPSQPIDPSAVPEEWSPDEKIYPDDVNIEPEPLGLQFHDPVADKTEWEFAERGGTFFAELHLAKTDSSKLEFKTNTTWAGIALAVASFIVGFLFVAQLAFGKISFQSAHFLSFLFSFAALVFGIILSFMVQHVVFDKYEGVFWKGWTIRHA